MLPDSIKQDAFRTAGVPVEVEELPVVTNLEDLNDVAIASVATGDLISWNGAEWQNKKQLTGNYGITGSLGITSKVTSATAKFTTIPIGTSENNILLVDASGNVVKRTDLSLTGAQGATGAQGTTGTQGSTGAQGPHRYNWCTRYSR
jgi:hypothetical protein